MSAKERSFDLESAITAAVRAQDDQAAWDAVESLADKLDRPDEVAAAYQLVLGEDLDDESAEAIGRRAVRFHEEWFGQDTDALTQVLLRVLELAPSSGWAFQRLTVAFTVAEDWSELLDLYNRALAADTQDRARQEKLLAEAYQIAKDLASRPSDATAYLRRLYALTHDGKQALALERLLEKHEKWGELVDFWEQRIDHVPPAERPRLRLRIASAWFDNLNEPSRALDTLRRLMTEPGREAADQGASVLLERLATAPQASPAVRQGALELLREHHEATGRADDLVRVVEAALPLADVERQIALHRDAAQRLAELGKPDAAIEHYAELLRLDPSSHATQRALRQLAQAADRMDRYAEAAAAAAERCPDPARKVALLTDAARVRLDLDNEPAAIELLRAALAEPGIPRSDVLTVGRRLDELYARAGRNRDRLSVLERLAAAETVASSQRALIGDLARLAEELGETDRALEAWRQRLERDSTDLGALGALIDLLERQERWADLVEALEQRAAADGAREEERRADLVRMAHLYERELGDEPAAISTWNRVRAMDGGLSTDTVAALTQLRGATGGWRELAELLDEATGHESRVLVDQLIRLGDAHRLHLGVPESALVYYRRALDIDVRQERARHGLIALLDVPACRSSAAEALGRAYRAVEDWPSYLTLVDARLSGADDDEKLRILREAAAIQERIGEPEAALGSLARAFPLAPKDRALSEHMVRLARQLQSYDPALDGFRRAAKALTDDPHGAAQLRAREAELLEERRDLEGAHGAYFAVLAVDPGNLAAVSAVVRIGSRLARWADVGTAIVDCIRTRGRIEEGLLAEVDTAANETQSYDEMCRVLTAAIEQGVLDAHLASELHSRVAIWHRDRRGDPESAEASFRLAAACDATRIDALRALVSLEERSPSHSLYESLERLADADPSDLDVVYRAAEVASDSLADRGLAKTSLNLLLGRATAAWRGTAPARGRLPASDYVAWAVDRLVDIYVMAQEATAALDLLVDASRLPFDAETRMALRHRAAVIADEVLHDEIGATEMYRGILGQRPDDLEAISRLAALYRKQNRTAELLALRRHELSLPLDGGRRLGLRLELVSLIDDIDRRGGRLELLRANLADQPGHEQSVAAVTELLTAAGRLRDLHDLLAEQGRKLETSEHGEPAARLWALAARLAERELGDRDRAIAAYRRVIALAPTQEALDALARLYMERGEPAEAVPWLERALSGAEMARKAEFSLRLARAHVGSERPDRAITCLERAVDEGAGNRDVRHLLADLYRQAQQWEPLATLLTESLPVLGDEGTVSAWAREAADIYHRRLGAPERALPALERALGLMPEDRSLRAMMAGSLRAAGDTARARQLLEKLIADFGRRRSKERAAVHVELAQVARAESKLDEAVRELEQASQMDVGNPHILRVLAQIAREGGQLDQAERSLRALLLVVRQQPPGDEPDAVGHSEVLFELHHIAKQRGDDEKASEFLDSALEAARQSDVEVARLRRVLIVHKQGEVLLRAIEARLAQAEEPASRAQLLLHAAEAEADLLGRPDAAFERLLEAMPLAPGRADLHARARAAAMKRPGMLARYLDVATAELDRMRRKQEAPRVVQLAMELGKLAEEEAKDLVRARDLYRLANRLADEPADSLFALSRVYTALGDTESQTRALDELAALAGDDEPSPQRADALYRLAQVQAESPEMVGRALELLERGLRIEMRHKQAADILRQAAAADATNRRVLDIYERVARVSGDPAMLLDYLERRIARDGGDDDSVKEAAELAARLGESERGEALLRTAVDAARRGTGGLAGAAWAALRLADRCVERGELSQAQALLLEVGGAAPASEFMELGLKLAARAADSVPVRAAEIYQLLLGRDPTARAVWQPLFELYRRLGDKDKLSALVTETLPQLVAVRERNVLRLLHARTLLAEARSGAAIELLRDALLDDPDDLEVAAMLESALTAGGNDEVLADFLTQRFEDAKTRGNPNTLADVALRLGALLERLDGDALSIYRDALEYAPDSRALLRAVAAGSAADESSLERAELLARLLAVEEEERAPALALELAGLWEQLGESDRAQEALEVGHRANPEEPRLRERLELWYHDHQLWDRLALKLIAEAERATEIEDGLSKLRRAAALYREQIGDMRRAAEVLDRARALAPDDVALVMELARNLAAGRDYDGGIRLLTQQLDRKLGRAALVDLLLLRAEFEAARGRDDESLADLEQAHSIDPERVGSLLRDGLERQRERAQARGDLERERMATMRLARVLLEGGQEVDARDLLVGWLERAASDSEALYLVLQMDTAAGRWDGVVAVCARLVSLEEGQAQIDVAVQLAEAGENAGMAQVAQQGLEYVHHVQPQSLQVRELLRRIYEKAGSYRELAGLLLADAEHATDDNTRYECFRQAADMLIHKVGDTEAAVLPAQRARELRPDDHETVCLVADVLIGSGQIREAVELVLPAIDGHKRRSPELAALQFRMARAAAATGDRDTQLAWLKRAFDVDRKDGTIAAELAQLATELGDYDLALKPLRAITLSDAPGPISRVMALLWEAKIEHARGNKAKAELWAKKALREDPTFSEAEEFLTQLSEGP